MRVVIIGGGFGGVKTALSLSKDASIDVTLISDKDDFVYYPALYATATGGSKKQSAIKLSDIFHGSHVKIIHDEITGIDTHRKHAVGKVGQYDYDYVVFALGVVTSYFGINGLDTFSYSIKSPTDVQRFKQHLHDELTTTKHLDKNYLVVGAGPTGVELSSALGTYIADIAEIHKVTHAKINISLVEAAPRVLPKMSETSSKIISKRLQKLGVKLMINSKVEGEDDDSLMVSGKDIPSQTVVWTSGVSNHPFFKDHADIFPLAKNGRIEVDSHLRVSEHIFVIGDNAATPYCGLAQTALHDALFTAKCLRAINKKRLMPTYRAVKPPVVIPVGPHWALLEWGPIRLWGRIGSWIRSAADLIGYSDVLPIGLAIGTWRAQEKREPETDCETCSGTSKA